MNASFRPRRFDLIGIGECMVEFYSAEPLASASQLQRAYGGDVLNALVANQRLGGKTGFVTKVGDDPFGSGLLAAWRQEGIDTSQAVERPGDNGVYFISVAPSGERAFTYRRHGTPASQLAPEDLDPAYIASSHWLLLSGITQALSPTARAATLAAARIALEAGVRIAYDPNYRPRLWALHGGLPAARAAFDEIAPFAEWLLPSHPADAALLGAEDALEEDMDAAFAMAERFASRAPNVALKCSADGCVLSSAGTVRHVAGAKADKVVDTTGAGDCWNGSFLFGLQQGQTMVDAATEANRRAAAKLAYRGAIPPAGVIK
ncbi:sugar kinase [Massilia sp. BSC265]|uniref:sugar kinase n=1 Tax=Massilia sp. BSC265 TaxID=1549812 RepID=UPI0004E944FA|nr:sugar kinase [Massilia sp. BSC265]KFI08827.1 carbohydrate kinase [Massilia sp. BSC265]